MRGSLDSFRYREHHCIPFYVSCLCVCVRAQIQQLFIFSPFRITRNKIESVVVVIKYEFVQRAHSTGCAGCWLPDTRSQSS